MRTLAFCVAIFLHAASAWAIGGYQPYGDIHWKQPVASVAALPTGGNQVGDVRIELTAFGEYYWSGSGWVALSSGGGGTPGGANTDLQFNSSGAFAGSNNLTWNGTVLGVVGTVNASNINDSALTSGLPIFSGNPFTTGTLSGNTTKLATTTGSLTSGDGVKIDASGNFIDSGSAPATVSSVGLSAPGEFTVSGSPVTGSGTLTFTKASETANSVWAAPDGTAGAPTFRALLGADLPTMGGASGVADGVQGAVPKPLAGQQNDCLLGSGSWGTCGSGTVTSVGLADGSTSPIFTISGSPVTGSGTLTFSLSSQTANKVFASPNGSSGQPGFRSLVGADLPNPSLTTLGGVESLSCGAGQALTGISTLGVPSCGSAGSSYTFADSVVNTSGTITLVGDSATPAASNYYGTDAGSSLGYHAFNIGLTSQVNGVLPIANGGTNVSSVTTAPTASAFAGWDANSNLSANNFIAGYATTATSGGTTTLTVASKRKQVFTGTSSQTVVLPAVSTLAQGTDFIIQNNSTGIVTVQSSGGNVITTLAGASSGSNGQSSVFTSNAVTGTSASVWDYPNPLGQVAQGYLVGQVVISGCSAPWTATASTATLMAGPTGCTATASGSVTAPTSGRPGLTIPNGGAGAYTVVYNGNAMVSSSSGLGEYYLCNGSNASCASAGTPGAWNSTTATQNVVLADAAGSHGSVPSLSWVWNATSSVSNLELDVYGINTGSATTYLYGTGAPNGTFSVYYMPSASQTVASLANVAASYKGSLAGTGGGWSGVTSVGSWSDFSVATTSTTLTTKADSTTNITCTAEATKLAAITCTLPYQGIWTVCATPPISNNTAGAGTYATLTDGSNSLLMDGVGVAIPASNDYVSLQICGDYNYSGSGSATFKLRGQVAGSSTEFITQSAPMPISWSIYPKTQSRPQPYATGNVSSTTTGQEHIERVAFGGAGGTMSSLGLCSSTPCTIVSQSGSWVTSVTRTSAGLYTVNFAAGEFSAAPTCTCNSTNAAPDACFPNGNSTSSVSITTYSSGASDSGVVVICQGPH